MGTKHKVQGFTLLELMIVLLIVGMLVVIAMYAYNNYSKKSAASEMLTLATSLKNAIGEFVAENGRFPTAGEPIPHYTSIQNTNYVSSITWLPGMKVINVVGRGLVSDLTLNLKGNFNSGDGSITWTCTASGNVSVAPSSCK